MRAKDDMQSGGILCRLFGHKIAECAPGLVMLMPVHSWSYDHGTDTWVPLYGNCDRCKTSVRIGVMRQHQRSENMKQSDRWRGIAAAMGYEPKAHLDVRPKSPWILERVERFRKQAAEEYNEKQ